MHGDEREKSLIDALRLPAKTVVLTVLDRRLHSDSTVIDHIDCGEPDRLLVPPDFSSDIVRVPKPAVSKAGKKIDICRDSRQGRNDEVLDDQFRFKLQCCIEPLRNVGH
ncbi:MAG: hypothetical protein H0T47_14695 [Planctomycetaceae bacterium]|nr:hypothetical protein [Planctomycetaceae bacterium]